MISNEKFRIKHLSCVRDIQPGNRRNIYRKFQKL